MFFEVPEKKKLKSGNALSIFYSLPRSLRSPQFTLFNVFLTMLYKVTVVSQKQKCKPMPFLGLADTAKKNKKSIKCTQAGVLR